MARKPRVPGLLRHSSGQGRVKLSGKIHYLGEYGSPACYERYVQLVRAWEAGGRQPLAKAATAIEVTLRVNDLLRQFLDYIAGSGRYHKAGRPTTHLAFLRRTLQELDSRFGEVAVAKFHDALLLQHRDDLETRRPALNRKTINARIAIIKTAFRWGFNRRIVPRDVWLGISALPALQRHECGNRDHHRPRRAVTEDDLEKAIAFASRQVAAMLRLQWLVGMRPGEVCAMCWADINMDPISIDGVAMWTYTVPGGKTEHHGFTTSYALPPKAQAILAEFRKVDSTAPIFSPAGAMAELSTQKRHNRRTKVTAYTYRRDSQAVNDFLDRYGVDVYGRALRRACERAGIQRFTPHELRHAYVTRAARICGALATSVAVNHRRVSTTEGYLHADRRLAYEVAARLEAS